MKKKTPRQTKPKAKTPRKKKTTNGVKRTTVVLLESDQKIIAALETDLISLNVKVVDLQIQLNEAVRQIQGMRNRYAERIREAGTNAGCDMGLDWHFDGPSMTMHPR
jgi:hypothetical protein